MKWILDGKEYQVFGDIRLTNSVGENSAISTDADGNMTFIKNNYSASGIPTVNDDSSEGYSISSVWYFNNEKYVCVDNTTGAAIWSNSTVEADDLGTMAVQDSDNVSITGGTATNGLTFSGTQLDITNSNFPAEGEINWNTEAGTAQIGMPGGDVALQVGQEILIKARASGSNILNGQVVYINGATGAIVEASLANNTDYNEACRTIAIATEDITENQQGYFTTFGLLRNIETDLYTEGDVIYLDSTDGEITNVLPVAPSCVVRVGYVAKKHATEGVIFVNILEDKSQTIRAITKEPTGFTNPQEVVITGDPITRTVTLTGTVNAYYRGIPNSTIVTDYTSPAHDTDTTKVYLLNYNGSTIAWTDVAMIDVDDYYDRLLVALAFYNSTDGNWVYQRECHGLMQWETHREFHDTIGTYRESGGTLADYTLASTTATDRRPSISATQIFDEDLETENPALPVGTYTQFYLSGADGTTNLITTGTDIVPLSTNQPYWNEFTGGAWQQTLITNGDYMNIWVLALPMGADIDSQKLRYLWVQGQAQFDNTTQADSETPNDVNLGALTSATPEIVFISKVTIRYIGGNWQFISVTDLTGTKLSQTQSPTGNYLSAVATDTTLTGLGTTSSPLGFLQLNSYDTDWVAVSTNLQSKTITVTHSLNTTLDNLFIKFLWSSDGTDANAIELGSYSSNPYGVTEGFEIQYSDTNNIDIVTASGGVWTTAGEITSGSYKVIVKKI